MCVLTCNNSKRHHNWRRGTYVFRLQTLHWNSQRRLHAIPVKKLHKDNIEVRVLLLTGGITVLNCCEIQVKFFQNLYFYRFHSKLQNIKFSGKLNYRKFFSLSVLCYLNWNIKMYLRLVSGIIKGTLLSVKQFPVNNWSCYPKEKYFNVWGIYLRVSWIK